MKNIREYIKLFDRNDFFVFIGAIIVALCVCAPAIYLIGVRYPLNNTYHLILTIGISIPFLYLFIKWAWQNEVEYKKSCNRIHYKGQLNEEYRQMILMWNKDKSSHDYRFARHTIDNSEHIIKKLGLVLPLDRTSRNVLFEHLTDIYNYDGVEIQ